MPRFAIMGYGVNWPRAMVQVQIISLSVQIIKIITQSDLEYLTWKNCQEETATVSVNEYSGDPLDHANLNEIDV